MSKDWEWETVYQNIIPSEEAPFWIDKQMPQVSLSAVFPTW